MNIGISSRFLIANKLEGIGRYALETTRRIVAAHPEHTFYCFFDRPFSTDFVFAANVVPVVLQPPARHPFLYVLWYEWAVARALRQYDCKVFYSPDGFLSLRSSVPTAMTMHDIVYHHRPADLGFTLRQYYKYYVPRFLRRAEHIFTVSNYVRQDVLQHINGINAEQISVTYNACNDSGFYALTTNEKTATRDKYTNGKPYFFYVGSIHPRKNLIGLLRGFEQFKTQNPTAPTLLLIAGRMAWKTSAIKTYYEQMQHREAVVFLDYVAAEALVQLVGAAHALCYVSLYEGFGIPILEGMYAEVPVLTSSVTSMPEVAADAALLVNPSDAAGIAEGLTQLYSDENLCTELVARGKLRREAFSWEVSAAHIWDKMMQITKDRKDK